MMCMSAIISCLVQLKHWSGFPATFTMEAAPVLEFSFWLLLSILSYRRTTRRVAPGRYPSFVAF